MENTITWTKNEYEHFLTQWKKNADETYRQFNEKIVKPSEQKPTLGIRSAVIKQTGKQICQGNPRAFLEVCVPHTHEEALLAVYVMCESPFDDYSHFLQSLERRLPIIDNWAICDSLSSALKKPLKKYKSAFWDRIPTYLHSENPWEVRFGLVAMLSHYIDEKHLQEALQRCDKVKSDHYYVKMGQAWFHSLCQISVGNQGVPFASYPGRLDIS